MTAATTFTLALLTVATSLATVHGWRNHGDHSSAALVRWAFLYVVAVVVPWVWALVHGRRAGDTAAAPVMTGSVVLLAALAVMSPARNGVSLGYLGVSAVGLLVAALLQRRFKRT